MNKQALLQFAEDNGWDYIPIYQKLSEEFIREFQDKIDWTFISTYQKLSEKFIREFQDKVNWIYISTYQKLSEEFIREFQDKVNWSCISVNQKLSEKFIREFQDKVDWYYISTYQKLSEEFIREFKISIPKTCWLYKSKTEKLDYIKRNTDYEVVDNDCILAYKSCRSDGYSKFNFQYKYEVGKEYTAHCDCNIDQDSSFGLSAWTKDKAISYCNERLFKVKIRIADIGAIVQDNKKIRSFRQEVIEEVS